MIQTNPLKVNDGRFFTPSTIVETKTKTNENNETNSQYVEQYY